MQIPAPTLLIRNARPEDAVALTSLLGELGFPATVETVTNRLNALTRADETVFVAERAQIVLGFVSVHLTSVLHRPTPVGRLTALIVAERARGQGIGRALVAAAERFLAAKACALVEITSNQKLREAHAFYEYLGYAPTSLRFCKAITPTP